MMHFCTFHKFDKFRFFRDFSSHDNENVLSNMEKSNTSRREIGVSASFPSNRNIINASYVFVLSMKLIFVRFKTSTNFAFFVTFLQ